MCEKNYSNAREELDKAVAEYINMLHKFAQSEDTLVREVAQSILSAYYSDNEDYEIIKEE